MRGLLLLFVLSLGITTGFSQSCGIYFIKYTAEVSSSTGKVTKVILPTPVFLHKLNNEQSFAETTLKDNKISLELKSHLTRMYDKPEQLLADYKANWASIPVVFIINIYGGEQRIALNIPWEKIVISRIENESVSHQFEINLGKIEL